MLLVVTAPAVAAPGDLDRSFGTGGRLFVEDVLGATGDDGTGLSSLRSLSDGRIVLLGTERCGLSCDPTLLLSRRTPAGAPDATLTAGPSPGLLAVAGYDDGDPESTLIHGSALRGDGGLVVGRRRPGASSLVAYGPDGTAGGPVASALPVAPDSVLPDGRVLGRTGRSVVRLTVALTPDPTFGTGRSVVIPAALRRPVAVVRSGQGIVSGSHTARGLALWRTDADGASHPTVSTVRVALRGAAAVSGLTAREVIATGGGRSILVGAGTRARNRAPVTLIAGFGSSGRADEGFGRGGLLGLSGRDAGVAVDRSGRIVVATLTGRASEPATRSRLIVRRFGPHGAPDPSFRPRALRLAGGYAGGVGVSVDLRGRIVVAVGFSPLTTPGGVVLHRLLG